MKKKFEEENDLLARKVDQFVKNCNKQLQNIQIVDNDDEEVVSQKFYDRGWDNYLQLFYLTKILSNCQLVLFL